MKKIGRNDPCHCGSGKKYKNCHQPADEGAPARPMDPASEAAASQLVNHGATQVAQGQIEAAVASFRQALALSPGRAELHSNLGTLLERLGRLDEAVASHRSAVALQPEIAELHNNLALALQAQGDYAQAEAGFKRALALKEGYAGAHFNLARLLLLQGRHKDALASARRVVELAPGDAQGHNNLGVTLEDLGQFEAAIACYRRALELSPGLVSAQKGVVTALGRLVPEWHVPMMNDAPRNEAYYQALRLAVTPDSHLFEIGTGSGLLSMMAAKLGAKSVVTCEAVNIIAATARQVIADNGLEERIRVVAKKSTELAVGAELPRPADIMVSEILSTELLGERVLDSIEDAKRRLLKPGARLIPAAGSIMLALCGGADIAANLLAGQSSGFDLSRFNSIVPRRQPVVRNDLNIEFLSADTEAFRFDFQGADAALPETKLLRIPVTRAGRCVGLIQWIRLELYADVVFENHPAVRAPASAWTHCAYVFESPVEVRPGQVAVIEAAHNRVFPWFTLKGFE